MRPQRIKRRQVLVFDGPVSEAAFEQIKNAASGNFKSGDVMGGVALAPYHEYEDKVPAEAHAIILNPTLVASRTIQLEPPYRGGPALADKAAKRCGSRSKAFRMSVGAPFLWCALRSANALRVSGFAMLVPHKLWS